MSGLRGLWRRLPRPWRAQALQAMEASINGLIAFRVRRVWRRGGAGGDPVTVLGFHRAVLGLGEAARLVASGFEDGGRRVRRTDVSALLGAPAELAAAEDETESAGVLISQINPPELLRMLALTGGRHLKGRRHIGYWSWELPEAPTSWRPAFDYVDEVWAPSEFTAEALRTIAPPDAPVRVVPHPVYRLPRLAPDRAAFGVEGAAPAVLVGFDLKSTVQRKNPWAALAAYEKAVPAADGSARLVLKVSGAGSDPAALAALKARTAARPDILLLDRHLDGDGMRRLMASVDVVLSLHRSEGFGLVPAEAMWLGKPVVCTGWSGNMDFMDEDSAGLVRYRIVDSPSSAGFYAGGRWADPDVDHAAELLGRLIRDPEHRRVMGERAGAKAEAVFSRERWLALVEPLLGRR